MNRFFKVIAATLFLGLFLVNCSNDSDLYLGYSSDSRSSSSSSSQLSSSSDLQPNSSSSSQPNTSSGSQQDTYLGYGYDVINSSYINRGDVKMLYPILDQERMISDGLVAFGSVGIQEFKSFVGNSLTKFYEERNENIGLGLSADVPFKSILFSGGFETEFGVKLSESRIDEHSYLRGRSYHYTHHEYIGKGRATAEKLVEYLSEGFAADLRSKTAVQILDRYGSHVFIQYYKGGVMEYNFAYFGTELTNSTELLTALKVSLSAKSQLLGASIGVSSSQNNNEKELREKLENNSTFHSYSYGGALVNISNPEQIGSNYTTWLNSIETKADICGIGKFDESFIPVWELAAASGKAELAEELESEFLDRAIRHGENMKTTRPVITKVDSFVTAGNHTYTLNKPATVEIYALGAGGGGQGGHFSDQFMGGLGGATSQPYGGTGGAGGGGGAAYMKLSLEQPTSFNIKVGRGGTGGAAGFADWLSNWQSGNHGEDGENTMVTWGTNTITSLGGKGGGGSGQDLSGGRGGESSSKPEIVSAENWLSVAGSKGTDGTQKGDISSTGGNAAKITNKGFIDSFGGGVGGVKGWRGAEAGGGGSSAYGRDQSGSTGGNGKVTIVVTYF